MAAQSLDVVIIGAGAAGLTAAYDLYRGENYMFKILEANSGEWMLSHLGYHLLH
jgi:cation diffusion facilitator CzcD-associated flavoprotein CzcO